jgi:hypothetical protein
VVHKLPQPIFGQDLGAQLMISVYMVGVQVHNNKVCSAHFVAEFHSVK